MYSKIFMMLCEIDDTYKFVAVINVFQLILRKLIKHARDETSNP
jgi:hypothetical protein